MPIIQITNTYSGRVLDIVKSCVPDCFDIRTLSENTTAALAECVADADYILASGRVQIGEKVLANAKNLKMIQRTGVGLDSLDLKTINAHGIPVYVNQGVNSQSVAEYSVLLILACLRKLCIVNQNCKSGVWQKQAQGIATYELCGKTVGLIGMGNIGQKVARILNSFGARVLYFDQFRQTEEKELEMNITYAALEEVITTADVISLHCPLNEQTYHLISTDTLRAMKDGVVIVNTARGALIDENALLRAIELGKVGCCGLDVHEEEPISVGDKLIASDHVIVTPHIAGITYDSFYEMISCAMRNIDLFEQGRLDEIEKFRLEIGM